jgi:hypothetical protein
VIAACFTVSLGIVLLQAVLYARHDPQHVLIYLLVAEQLTVIHIQVSVLLSQVVELLTEDIQRPSVGPTDSARDLPMDPV